MFFSFQTPKAWAAAFSSSERRRNGRSYFVLNFSWAAGLSGEMPTTVAPFSAKDLACSRNSRASRVQPGVSAFG
jgi:hypothetical protein